MTQFNDQSHATCCLENATKAVRKVLSKNVTVHVMKGLHQSSSSLLFKSLHRGWFAAGKSLAESSCNAELDGPTDDALLLVSS